MEVVYECISITQVQDTQAPQVHNGCTVSELQVK